MKPLTPEERRILIDKGTERPFSGRYYRHDARGTYLCRQCGAPLYRSSDKFDAGCGWPSFDDAIPGAVRRTPDADGRRVEITCARCGGHLGHVFTGEGFTLKNTRYCVNSLSLQFESAAETPDDTPASAAARSETERQAIAVPSPEHTAPASGSDASRTPHGPAPASSGEKPTAPQRDTAIYAGGCFWGVEYYMEQVPGVERVESGYIGGHTANPTYEEVCRHTTGHAEAVRVIFDPLKVSYETLTRRFFEIHDPTQRNGQGPDIGEQYRSEIFYRTPEQRATAERLIARLRANGYDVATRLTPAGPFYPAESYHQDYYRRKGTLPYCHRYTRRF